jgi:hypothetical protein
MIGLLLILIAVLAGGLYLGWRGLHSVPDRKVGIVYRRLGRDPQDRYRVRLHGSAGPQADTLEPSTRNWLMPFLFEVRYVDQIRVPDGTIGLVEATAGAVRPPGRRLCRYVECDYFQDGATFLRNGGEQGRQLGILPGGAYYSINTELFTVLTVATIGPNREDGLAAAQLHEIEVLEGNAGVVIVSDGRPPDDEEDALGVVVPGHDDFRLPWVFLANGGQWGVQEQTLHGGSKYAINPWFAKVVLVPTRDLHLEWTRKESKAASNLDSSLEQIVVDIDGHRLSLEMSQILRIPASAAPRLVRRFGEQESGPPESGDVSVRPAPVQRFVERVLGAAVAGYFTALVGKYTVLQFIEEYDDVRLQLQDQVVHALRDWGVIASQTVLAEFTSEDREINDLRRRRAAIREEGQILVYENANAEVAARARRIAIELDGESQVTQLRKQIEILGPQNVAIERIAAHMAKMPVPQYISGTGDLTDQILRVMPFASAQDMLRTVADSAARSVPTEPVVPQVMDAEPDAVAAAEAPAGGPQSAGPHSAGPRSAGPPVAEPQSAGPQPAGSHGTGDGAPSVPAPRRELDPDEPAGQ